MRMALIASLLLTLSLGAVWAEEKAKAKSVPKTVQKKQPRSEWEEIAFKQDKKQKAGQKKK
jgi:hypothetical protein